MGCQEANCAPGLSEKHVLAVSYNVDGDVRFISHHDTLRMFRRALARAGIPVRFSEGFNPHPRLNIPLPRPVGVASGAELLVVELSKPVETDEAHARLSRHLPKGIRLTGVRKIEAGERPNALEARYQLDTGDSPADHLAVRVRHILESDVVEVERFNPKKGPRRMINVRPYVKEMHLAGQTVVFTLLITRSGTAKPAEIAALLGYNPDSINHRIRRMEVRWQ